MISANSPTIDLAGEPVVDHHTHPVAQDPIEDSYFHPFSSEDGRLTGLELLQLFSLGGFVPDFLQSDGHEPSRAELDRLATSAANTLLVAVALKELAAYFGCEEDAQAIVDARFERTSGRYADYVRELFAHAGIGTVFIDNGWPQPPIPLEAMAAQMAPARVLGVYRIEPLIQRLVAGDGRLSDIEEEFERSVRAAVEDDGYVALKSIIAYRTGLAVERVGREQAQRALDAARRAGDGSPRDVMNFCFVRALELARELQVPLHVHCGIGENNVRMPQAMPHCLYPILTDPALRHATVVLVHAGFPWVEEAGFMANVLPNVYVDVSLPCPASGGALPDVLLRLLEMAPFNKVLYGSDGLIIPEIAWLSARLIRRGLGECLSSLVERDYLSQARAGEIGRRILWRNAAELYELEQV